MPAPVPLAMVICDAVHEDPTTGKKTILGTFTAVQSPEFPATVGKICIYLALTDARGTVPIRLSIVDVDELRPPIIEQSADLNFLDPITVEHTDFDLIDVIFPSPGEYRIQLFAGDEFVIERRLNVSDEPLQGI